ncbi:MAG TPA: mandelate racemase/muconate lactonizing enzyme family protein [Thermomicrobiales bacterium]|nr:mandelate racemase/muconate lactonizing enzyme family protein [Thermomicrobiales bacterium]
MRVVDLRPLVLSVPLARPVRAAFGTMTHRHAILVEVVTDEGLVGLGESWSNFPAWAPAERLATLEQGVKPLLVGQDPADPPAVTRHLLDRLEPIGRQWGARGPIHQAVSAVDIALWDIKGQREGKPICALLADQPLRRVPVYASGLGPTDAAEMARPYWEAGVRALKLKVGFGRETDRANLAQLRAAYPDAAIAVDANQKWDEAEALAMAPLLAKYACRWMEEPVPASELDALRRLRAALPCPVAGGENYYGAREFARVLDAGALGLVQPDVCKTGGISEMVAICRAATAAGLPYAPHYLGGAVGVIASLHVFAAVPGGLIMELDANPNPLREALLEASLAPVDGMLPVPDRPGLGVALNQETVERYRATA